MKKSGDKYFALKRAIATTLVLLIITGVNITAKSKPMLAPDRVIAFKRAQSLDNGINVSWLEQNWNNDLLTANALKTSDFVLLKKLGFKSLRLPVAFKYFESKHIPREKVFAIIDKIITQCKVYGFKLIIDYHYGELNDNNYFQETKMIIDTWLTVAKRYRKVSPNDLFFELYNEPERINPKTWNDAAYNILTAIRKVDKKRTIIIGATNYNSVQELSRFTRLADENVIYTFHFYEPFLFTHQGAAWVGNDVASIAIPFPYNAAKFPPINGKTKGTTGETYYNQYPREGTLQAVKDKLLLAKKWGDKYQVPVLCGEYGAYNKYADADSRCNYIKAVRTTLKAYHIPGIIWDYSGTFSIFNGAPSFKNLPDCMKDAIGYMPGS